MDSSKTFVKDMCAKHSTAVATTVGLLIVAVIVLFYMWHQAKKAATVTPTKSGFAPAYGNFRTGNNNPNWQYGSGDAGEGGSVDRRPTVYSQVAISDELARDLENPSIQGCAVGGRAPVSDAEIRAVQRLNGGVVGAGAHMGTREGYRVDTGKSDYSDEGLSAILHSDV